MAEAPSTPFPDYFADISPQQRNQMVQRFLSSVGSSIEASPFLGSDNLSRAFLIRLGVWPESESASIALVECPAGHGPMRKESRADYNAGFRWICRKGPRGQRCSLVKNPSEGSFVDGIKFSPRQLFTYLYYTCVRVSQVQMTGLVSMANTSVSSMKKYCYDAMSIWAFNRPQIGGPGKIVEVDEHHLATRKNNVGQVLASQQEWVLGMVERGSRKFVSVRVPDRTKSTMVPILRRFIHEDSVIMTDGWASYAGAGGLGEYFADHCDVNHSENFVNPTDRSVHTQQVESCWKVMESSIRCYKAGDCVDRELGYHMYRYDRFWDHERGEYKSLARMMRFLCFDLAKVHPGPGTVGLGYPYWVHVRELEGDFQWPHDSLLGINIQGIGYEQYLNMNPVEWPQLP